MTKKCDKGACHSQLVTVKCAKQLLNVYMPTVRARGDSFQALVRLTVRGQLYNESRSFATESMARDWAQRLEDKLKTEGVPQRKLDTTTLGSLIERYETSLSAVQTIRQTRQHEYAALAHAFSRVRLSDINAETFTRYATQRKEKDAAGPATILHNLATLRSVLNAAKPMYGLNVNTTAIPEALAALSRMGVVTKSKSRSRRPTPDELGRIRAEFQRIAPHPSTILPMATIIDLAVALPRRLGELTDMKWVDYSTAKRTLTLRDTKHPSAPRDEVVPVPPAAARIIKTLPVFDECLLPYEAQSISSAFRRCCKRLNILDLHFHDLRHHGISALFEQGLGVHEVAPISGHLSWTSLRRYTHMTPDQVLEKLK